MIFLISICLLQINFMFFLDLTSIMYGPNTTQMLFSIQDLNMDIEITVSPTEDEATCYL